MVGGFRSFGNEEDSSLFQDVTPPPDDIYLIKRDEGVAMVLAMGNCGMFTMNGNNNNNDNCFMSLQLHTFMELILPGLEHEDARNAVAFRKK